MSKKNENRKPRIRGSKQRRIALPCMPTYN